MIWETFKQFFVGNVTGSYLLTGVFFLIAIWFVLFLMNVREEVFVAVTTFYVYFLTIKNIFPRWIFFISIMLSAVIIGKNLIKIIFNS